MKNLRILLLGTLACVATVSFSSCGNSKTNSAEAVADSVEVDGKTIKTDTVDAEATVQDEKVQSVDIDKQEISDLLRRSLDDEKCFSAEYVRLWNQAARVSEAGLWNILPGSIFVPKSITLDKLDIKSETKATGKITMIAVDFEDENNKQVIPATIYLIKENGKWVIDDVDDTKNDYRECVENAAEAE